MSCVSIIIPTLNEVSSLGRTLRHLQLLDPPAWEVVIVDGSSNDGTVELAQSVAKKTSLQIKILTSTQRGRSVQMNRGAEVATGDVLCFLHADTQVPDDLVTVIKQTLADQQVSCGGFISLMSGTQVTRWGISLHNYLKTYYAPLLFRPHRFFGGLRLLFGDQVMFCRRDDFWTCEGFNESLPIMEDGDLCLKLAKLGRIRQVNRIVQSSDRRVARCGALKATGLYLYIGVLWGVGVSTTYLKQFYEDIR